MFLKWWIFENQLIRNNICICSQTQVFGSHQIITGSQYSPHLTSLNQSTDTSFQITYLNKSMLQQPSQHKGYQIRPNPQLFNQLVFKNSPGVERDGEEPIMGLLVLSLDKYSIYKKFKMWFEKKEENTNRLDRKEHHKQEGVLILLDQLRKRNQEKKNFFFITIILMISRKEENKKTDERDRVEISTTSSKYHCLHHDVVSNSDLEDYFSFCKHQSEKQYLTARYSQSVLSYTSAYLTRVLLVHSLFALLSTLFNPLTLRFASSNPLPPNQVTPTCPFTVPIAIHPTQIRNIELNHKISTPAFNPAKTTPCQLSGQLSSSRLNLIYTLPQKEPHQEPCACAFPFLLAASGKIHLHSLATPRKIEGFKCLGQASLISSSILKSAPPTPIQLCGSITNNKLLEPEHDDTAIQAPLALSCPSRWCKCHKTVVAWGGNDVHKFESKEEWCHDPPWILPHKFQSQNPKKNLTSALTLMSPPSGADRLPPEHLPPFFKLWSDSPAEVDLNVVTHQDSQGHEPIPHDQDDDISSQPSPMKD
ncbi:hypothetical protein VP01_149g3 [Puccinia sorghi]|uniref:Uncharacterized protein n=1 Tax=Puccinia sorghi TaxID=27349 RepID=A0A0L6VJA3_9BASI|nr:hypothetical protein VP01_149g3 [Puccinia sorghi]